MPPVSWPAATSRRRKNKEHWLIWTSQQQSVFDRHHETTEAPLWQRASRHWIVQILSSESADVADGESFSDRWAPLPVGSGGSLCTYRFPPKLSCGWLESRLKNPIDLIEWLTELSDIVVWMEDGKENLLWPTIEKLPPHSQHTGDFSRLVGVSAEHFEKDVEEEGGTGEGRGEGRGGWRDMATTRDPAWLTEQTARGAKKKSKESRKETSAGMKGRDIWTVSSQESVAAVGASGAESVGKGHIFIHLLQSRYDWFINAAVTLSPPTWGAGRSCLQMHNGHVVRKPWIIPQWGTFPATTEDKRPETLWIRVQVETKQDIYITWHIFYAHHVDIKILCYWTFMKCKSCLLLLCSCAEGNWQTCAVKNIESLLVSLWQLDLTDEETIMIQVIQTESTGGRLETLIQAGLHSDCFLGPKATFLFFLFLTLCHFHGDTRRRVKGQRSGVSLPGHPCLLGLRDGDEPPACQVATSRGNAHLLQLH